MGAVKTEKIYTVLEVNGLIKKSVKTAFPECIWVCGEIQDLRQRQHINFTLCEKHSEADQVVAKIKAVIFEDNVSYIEHRLKQADLQLVLKQDIEVKLLCRVDFYPKSGHISLVVLDVDPVYTLGKIAQTRQRIIETLKEKGLLDKNKELQIPDVSLRVGLITSFDSAAYHDFFSELKNFGFGFKIQFYDSYMQGENVRRDVLKGLKFFNSLSRDDLDVIVITRGGGSTADLSWFDDEKIAEAIANSKFPVLTAVGHEINVTVADMVACSYYKTPTAIAQFLGYKVKEFIEGVEFFGEQILSTAQSVTKGTRESLVNNTVSFERFLLGYFEQSKETLAKISTHISAISERNILHRKFEVDSSVKNMMLFLSSFLAACKKDMSGIDEKINLLLPRNILKRGFSITYREDGKALRDTGQLRTGEVVRTVLSRGEFESKVVKKHGKR